MEKYEPSEIDITQWKPKKGDKILLCVTKTDTDLWKGELYKSYGLYYKTFIKDFKVQDMLNLGWELKK